GTQYGIKLLVDTLTRPGDGADRVWPAFGLLIALIAADTVLWRLAGLVAHSAFVGVTGDLRRELFRHLTGHAPGYFAQRMPGTLASRITATSNAVFSVENMFVWNVLPPCAATAIAISLVGTVSASMAVVLMPAAGLMVVALFRLAAAGQSLHHDFADKAAAVDGEMVDVIANMPLVLSFCGLGREYRRFDATVAREMAARRSSLLYLERLRILHAAVTIVLAIGILRWGSALWPRRATPSSPARWPSPSSRPPAASPSLSSTSPSILPACRRRWRRCCSRTNCATTRRRRAWSAVVRRSSWSMFRSPTRTD